MGKNNEMGALFKAQGTVNTERWAGTAEQDIVKDMRDMMVRSTL